MAYETELKLELAPEAADALVQSELLAGRSSVTALRSIYFDTPAGHLSRAGLSLRIREAAGRRVQTVKAAGTAAAGLFARPEWERGVETDTPVLDDTVPVRARLGDKLRDIAPVFEIRVERRAWNLIWETAAIELAMDRGEVVAGERRAPICEIELELKRGRPAALFSLARKLDAIAPLRLGVLAKAERGHRLLGPAARAHKTEPLALSADMTAAAAFHHIADACLRQFRMNETLIGPGNEEALHQARVALRRLRSAFAIFAPMLEDDAFPRLREETRWLAGTLADARDLDVLIARIRADTVSARLQQARGEAYERAAEALASPRVRALMLDLSEWIALGEWQRRPENRELCEQPVRAFAIAALDRFRRKVKKGGRDLAALEDEVRHEVRKDAKKLRYAGEFFAALFAGKRRKRRLRRFLDAIGALQDRLGALNDMAAAKEVLGRIGIEGDPAAAPLLGTQKKRRALIEAAGEAHGDLIDTRRFWR